MKKYLINTIDPNIQFYINSHDTDVSVSHEFKQNRYEPHVQLLISNFIGEKKNLLDIGANYGQHSLFMSKLCPESNIVSIEASDKNIECFKQSILDNNCKNINIQQAFLSDKKKRLDFIIGKEVPPALLDVKLTMLIDIRNMNNE